MSMTIFYNRCIEVFSPAILIHMYGVKTHIFPRFFKNYSGEFYVNVFGHWNLGLMCKMVEFGLVGNTLVGEEVCE